jgi:hypothetical protein
MIDEKLIRERFAAVAPHLDFVAGASQVSTAGSDRVGGTFRGAFEFNRLVSPEDQL